MYLWRLRPIHTVAHPEISVWLGIDDGGVIGHQLFRTIEERERTMQIHRHVDGFLQQVRIIMTVEQESVGVVIVQEQDQLEIIGILGKVVGYLAAQGLIALDAPTGMDFLEHDVTIGKVQHTVERAYIVGLQLVLTKGLGILCQELISPVLGLEVQLAGQLRTYALCPHFAEYHDVTVDGLQTFTQTLEEWERLA